MGVISRVASRVVGSFAMALSSLAFGAEMPQTLGIDISPSQASNFGARNIFINPAANGFERELNGSQFLGSFAVAEQRSLDRAFALGISYGRFGAGLEEIPVSDGKLTRFSYGIGVPLSPSLFFGTRHRIYRGSSPSLSEFSTWDLGLQYRPFQWLAVGVLTNAINYSVSPVGAQDYQRAIGISLRPIPKCDLSIDYREHFGGVWRATTKLLIRPLTGLQLEAGFDEIAGFQFGLQLAINSATLFSQFQRSTEERSHVFGIDVAPLPREDAAQVSSTLVVNLNSSLTEAGAVETFLSPGRPSLLELLRTLERAKETHGIRQIDVRIKHFSLGFASALELHDALAALRKEKKVVHAYLGQAGMREYLIASAADKVFIEPSGELRLMGLSVQRYFLKGTLDKIGLEGEFLAKGEYKSAPEMITRRDSSPASRRATLEELRRAEAVIIDRLVRNGRTTPDRWKRVNSKALFSANAARAEGLVDEIEAINANDEAESPFRRLEATTRSTNIALSDRISIIALTGDISEGQPEAAQLMNYQAITPERVEALLKVANADSRTRAILLRVSSPGGEVMASHQIAEIIARSQKPVYVSMGDMAASGGYMISAPARRIVATELTYTGSIGVFLGKPNFGELYKKIDLNKEIISDSPTAGLNSEHRSWTPEERSIMMGRLNEYYDGFTSFVSEKRRLSKEQVESAAQGRVWLGGAAHDRKLIDAVGGMAEAIRLIAKEEGLSDYVVSILRPSPKITEYFAPPGLVMGAREILLRELGVDESLTPLRWSASLRKNPVLFWESQQFTPER